MLTNVQTFARPFFQTMDDLALEFSNVPSWAIDSLILHKSATLIFGAPKDGKTFLAINIALALANGNGLFLGRSVDVPAQRVGYIACDIGGRREVYQRGELINAGVHPNLLISGKPESLYALPELCRASRVQVVVLDNVLRALPDGADVSEAAGVSHLLSTIELLTRQGVTVIGVHHEGRSQNGKPMGSTAIDAGFRHFVHVDLDRSGTNRTLNIWGNEVAPYPIPVTLDGATGRYLLRDSGADDVTTADGKAARPSKSQANAERREARKRELAELLRTAGPFASVVAAGSRLEELADDVKPGSGRNKVNDLISKSYLTKAHLGL